MQIKSLIFILVVFSHSVAKDELIPIEFENLDLKQLIKISSKVLEKNILLNSELNGKVNFISNKPLKKSTLLNILQMSLHNNNLQMVNNGDFYTVSKKIDTTKKENKKVKEDKIVDVISLRNIEGKNLIDIVEKFIKKERLNIFTSLDIDSNSIVIVGNKTEIVLIKSLIKKLDKDQLQLYLKAKIVELNSSLVDEIGVKYGLFSKNVNGSDIYTISSSLNSSNEFLSEIKKLNISIPTISSSLALGASLNLLHQNYALDILSEPSILCINNKKSLIYVGESISLQNSSTVSSGGNTSFAYERKDIGLKLEVKPRVSNEKVRLEVNAVIEAIKNSSTNNQPDTMKKQIKTSAIVTNGESIILGGLIEKRNEKQKSSIPGLSSLPLVGELFTYKNDKNEKKNLAIIITPYIIPKSKDLTFIRNELAKIKKLEAKVLERSMKKIEKKVKDLSYKEQHKQRVKEMFNL